MSVEDQSDKGHEEADDDELEITGSREVTDHHEVIHDENQPPADHEDLAEEGHQSTSSIPPQDLQQSSNTDDLLDPQNSANAADITTDGDNQKHIDEVQASTQVNADNESHETNNTHGEPGEQDSTEKINDHIQDNDRHENDEKNDDKTIDLTGASEVEYIDYKETDKEDEDVDEDDDDEEEAEIINISSTQRISDPSKVLQIKAIDIQDSADSVTSTEAPSDPSEDNDVPSKKGAAGTIDYGSYSKGPKDRLVSRLVSNFESQMDSSAEIPKVERRAFSKAKLRTITSPVSSTFPVDPNGSDNITVGKINEDEKDQYVSDINSKYESREASDSTVIPDIVVSGNRNSDDESITDQPLAANSKGKYSQLESDTPASKSTRIPTFQLKPIETVQEEVEEDENIIFGLCVVGFHHARGPEVEYWVGPDGDKSTVWPYLAFQSLPDGSHVREENFCYFTLLYDDEKKIAVNPTPKRDKDGHIIEESDFKHVTTLFGISCNRQIKTEDLKHVTDDITRSTVQKSVVVVARKPIFGPIKDKLAVVTRAYFIQGDFEDRQLIDNLYENLTQIFTYKLDDASMNIGMPLRELIYRLGSKVLVIFKALLLEKRILFFASNTELLCASQFSLVSLIPNLINNLEDCGSPLLSSYETNLKKPTSLRTSDRSSLLAFMGLPLQLFAGGGIFNPYVPLQQLSELQADETKYFLVGSTNSLVLAPKSAIADVIVNVS